MTNKEKQPLLEQPLIECKYDYGTNDIFPYLTREGFRRLRKWDAHNFTLTVTHEKTKTRFDLLNLVSNHNNDVLEVFDISPKNRSEEWYRVILSDKGYKMLQNALDSGGSPEQATVMTRYGTGFKVAVTIDEERAIQLTEVRTNYGKR